MAINFYEEAQSLFPYTQKHRRDFHMHPEIGFQEVRTAGIVAKELKELGIEVTTGIAKTGVVGIIEGKQPGPVVLLRFDMDALPVTEETGVEYASKTPGVMHACGHDGHTAIGLTVAQILHKYQDQIDGTVKLVFQPAEEGLGGAKLMVEEGVLDNPRPDYSLSMHVWNDRPTGQIAMTPGAAMAGSEKFTLEISGKGAHGASPHLGFDPILAASQIVGAVQSIVSRNVDPLESAVISITAIEGGTAFNIIPPKVEMKGTIRTYAPEVRDKVLRRLKEVVEGVAQSMECQANLTIENITPAVVNDEKLAGLVNEVRKQVLPGTEDISGLRTMGSEDMAYMMDEIPGCYIFVGSKNEEKDLIYGHHHPKFNFDEQAMLNGVTLMSATAMALLNSNQ
ncbi:MAG: amidohydrolase [candidate division Zixibacteria bacterium]|nr:amidohydrolase [Gammaproteobacteria bacterium]NIX58516.1 amidohydrolase [candidate division Zixibacteria bacterium]